jgi:glyoxylase-like metal-dependent hydrolase (beta-lactamase superfamily II)
VPVPEPIDLHHQGRARVIGSYLVETERGLAVADCGPASCIAALRDGLRERGVGIGDLRHLLLSHIHLDHAGAAGVLVRANPELQVHVSEVGAPHLVDPARLERSARRLYGDDFDRLWGELAPVPEENVHVVGRTVVGLACFPSPGHASHHVCYLDRDGTLLAGDATGVRIQPSASVAPPTPPPDVDVDAWLRTLDEISRAAPMRLALTHFGVATDVERHLEELRSRLLEWAARVADGASEEDFGTAAEAELGDDFDVYESAMPLWQSYAGLRRWAERRAPA